MKIALIQHGHCISERLLIVVLFWGARAQCNLRSIWVVLVQSFIKNHIQFDIVRRLLCILPRPFQFASLSNGIQNVDEMYCEHM